MHPTTLLRNAATAQVAPDAPVTTAGTTQPQPVVKFTPDSVSFGEVWTWLGIGAAVVIAFVWLFKKFYGMLSDIDSKQTKVESMTCKTSVIQEIDKLRNEMHEGFSDVRGEVNLSLTKKANLSDVDSVRNMAMAQAADLALLKTDVAVIRQQLTTFENTQRRIELKLDRALARVPTLKPGQAVVYDPPEE